MSTKDESGALNPESGGAGTENQIPQNDQKPAKDTVNYETYQRAVTEAKKAKEALRKAEEELKAKQEAELKETNNYKELVKLREQELEKERLEKSSLQSVIESGSKMQAFLAEVQGDLPQQFWSLVDLDKIVINPETKMPDKQAVTAYAREFEQQYSRVLDKPNAGKLPANAPQAGNALTYEAWLKMSPSEKRKNLAVVAKLSGSQT
jgi:hypothetical protein